MKIIASDFDGTINYHGKISDADKAAIKRFRAAGNKFGIVTGRDVELSLWIRQKDGFEFDFIICCTGAVIRGSDGKIAYMKKGEVGPFFFDIIEKAKECGADFFTIGDVMYKCYIDMSGAVPTDISKMTEFTHANCGFSSDEGAIAFTEYVEKNYSDKISVHRNGWCVDMPPVNTSKVTGIYEYASQFENPEIYAVGDNVNDLLMIKEFNGYAVSNAVETVKNAAPNQCDRICDMIEELMEEK